jgi:Zn-dependent protease with chaperone function
MDFFARQAAARRSSRLWLAAFITAMLLVVAALTWIVLLVAPAADGTQAALQAGRFGLYDQIVESPGVAWKTALFWLLVIAGASAWRGLDLRDGGGAVAAALGGTRVERDTRDPRLRRLHNIVEEMAIASGVTMPEVYVLERESAINAFAAGQNPANAAVAVTRGAVERLNREQLQGVIAHEFSHILNGDMRLNVRMVGWLFGLTFIALAGRMIFEFGGRGSRNSNDKGIAVIWVVALAMIVVGYLGALAGRILQAAVCRRRESLADASAVQFTRNPDGLKGALLKIAGLDRHGRLAASRTSEVAHMLFAAGLDRAFATHPPLAERIRALDPSFDTTTLERVAKRAIADATPDSDLAQLTSRMQETRFAVEPAQVAAAVGRIESPDIDEAARLRLELPPGLHDFAESTGMARELVIELLLARDPGVRAAQLRLLEATQADAAASPPADPQRTAAARSLAEQLDPHLRLPALLQLFPALRQLPREQRLALLRLLRDLARADARIDVHEFCLLKLLACSMSSIRSSMCSMPIDSRTRSSETPALASSSGDSWRCVVVAGWQASDLASPMLTRRTIRFSASMNFAPASRPPLMPNETMPEALPPMYLSASGLNGESGRPAYCTQDTCGCARRYSAMCWAFSQMRSMRRCRVSMPCRIRKLLNGEIAAPMLRSGTTRARPM